MPRAARASVGEYCDHVINRGNARAEVFHAEGDYQACVTFLKEASEREPGNSVWIPRVATSLGLEASLRPLGRPRKLEMA